MRVAAIAVSALLVIVVGWLTLGPQPMGDDGWLAFTLELFRSRSGFDLPAFLGAEFAANLALFVPVGFVLVTICGPRRWWLASALALAITVGIESVQGMLPDRISDPRDIVANAVGAAIGISAGVLLRLRRTARDRRGRAKGRRAAAPAG